MLVEQEAAVAAMKATVRSTVGAVTDRQLARALIAALTVLTEPAALDNCFDAQGEPLKPTVKRRVREWAEFQVDVLVERHDLQRPKFTQQVEEADGV